MTFEQWMAEMARVALVPEKQEPVFVYSKLNDRNIYDYEEDESLEKA
jgi:hypothetical protein